MAAGNTYTQIASTTLGSAATDVTFSSIPSTYTDLVLVMSGQMSSSASLAMRINGDTGSNYSTTEILGDGTSALSKRASNDTQTTIASIHVALASGAYWVSTLHFQNYSNTTTYKTTLGRTSAAAVVTNGIVTLYRSTSAISSIKLMGYNNSAGFSTGSTFNLYGIAAA